MPYLDVRTPQGVRRLTLGADPLTVGRHPECGIHANDDRLSRRHCVVEPCGDGFRVRDLDSRNGTKVNGVRVAERVLRNGDTVDAGGVQLQFIDPEEVAPSRRRQTPDFAAAAAVAASRAYDAATLDVDLGELVGAAKTDYEKRLLQIIEGAPDRSFDAEQIGLVDARGVTVHAASGDGEESAESVRVLRLLLLACFRARATDIHMEPRGDTSVVRLRVDGYMLTAVEFSAAIARRVSGMIKILCEIDTSTKPAVQDGHFSATVPGRKIDFRVSFTPSVHGQKLVIRVLDSSNAPSRLHELGLLPWMYDKLRRIATRDAGMLLACGPTGSGKTTTLYSCLREIDVEQRNAITIEDPVEYQLPGATQIPIDAKQGLTFATILRSVLRQDPDVIFLGEIRDIETANVAMQAAMTGHLVYSTVHAKDTIGAIFRLLDLGVEQYLVANAVNMIVAQRLVRLLCVACRRPVRATPQQSLRMGQLLSGVPEIYTPQGCIECLESGFRGRRALFELLEFTDPLRDAVLKSPSIQGIREILRSGLFTSLQQFGFQLVAQGHTSYDEVERVAGTE
jgi:general secretion pathway protein E